MIKSFFTFHAVNYCIGGRDRALYCCISVVVCMIMYLLHVYKNGVLVLQLVFFSSGFQNNDIALMVCDVYT